MNYHWQLLAKFTLDKNNYKNKLISILLKNRHITGKEAKIFINPPHPNKISLKELGVSQEGVEKSKKRIIQARENKDQVIVYGDYDADGLCSTAIVWETLYQNGLKILPFIPDRIKDGYGLKPQKVKELKDKLPDLRLIITVDNGITAFQGVEQAKELGIDVITIDHHLKLQDKYPQAYALIHSPLVSATGLAWLWSRFWGIPDLGLAALATIADVMPLVGANRSFVKYGLPILQKTRRVGIRHLFQEAGIEKKVIDVFQVAFMLAPRLNALGRVADPLDGLRLICTKRLEKGIDLAKLANKINSQRQQMVEDGIFLAKELIGKKLNPILIVENETYHKGIIGLIASKLTEEFYRPSLVIRKEKELSYGSARSIDGIDIISLLKKVGKFMEELGGHQKAAGFTLKTKYLPKIKERLLKIAQKEIPDNLLTPTRVVDCEVKLSSLNLDFYNLVSKISPFGEGNPEPVFLARNLRVLSLTTVGKEGNHLKLTVDDPATPLVERIPAQAIGFQLGELASRILPGDFVDLLFSLTLDCWNGRQSLSLKIKDLKISSQMIK